MKSEDQILRELVSMEGSLSTAKEQVLLWKEAFDKKHSRSNDYSKKDLNAANASAHIYVLGHALRLIQNKIDDAKELLAQTIRVCEELEKHGN